jgi:hypothetical protein
VLVFRGQDTSCKTDGHAIEALGSALAGSDRPLIVTSGTALLSPGRLAIEEHVPAFGPETFPCVASEEAALSMASQGVRTSVYTGDLAQRLSYSSWRSHQTPVFSLRPLGARSSHWYMPQRPSSPRA